MIFPKLRGEIYGRFDTSPAKEENDRNSRTVDRFTPLLIENIENC